jgi:hypothetical protein
MNGAPFHVLNALAGFVGFFSLFFDSPGGLQSETVDVSSTL